MKIASSCPPALDLFSFFFPEYLIYLHTEDATGTYFDPQSNSLLSPQRTISFSCLKISNICVFAQHREKVSFSLTGGKCFALFLAC